MHKILKQSMAIFIIVAMLFVPAGYAVERVSHDATEKITEGKMLVDFFVFRPLGIVATVGGAAFFAISLPFSVLGGNAKMAGKKMVADPFLYTFDRKLGGF